MTGGLIVMFVLLLWFLIPYKKDSKSYARRMNDILHKKHPFKFLDPALRKIKSRFHLQKKKWAYQTIHGLIKGVSVEIKIEKIKSQKGFIIIASFKSKSQKLQNLLVSAETPGSRFKKVLGFEDYLTGDKGFDDLMLLKAAKPDELLLLLDSETRKQITKLTVAAEIFKVTRKHLKCTLLSKNYADVNSIYMIIENIILIAGKMNTVLQKTHKTRLLLENIFKEDNQEVKINMIKTLGKFYDTNSDYVKAELEKILHGADEQLVKVAAAKFIGKKGEEYLIRLLELYHKNELLEIEEVMDALQKVGTSESLKSLFSLLALFSDDESPYLLIKNTIKIINEREDLTRLDGGISLHHSHETDGGLSTASSKEDGMISLSDEKSLKNKNDEKKVQQQKG